MWFKMHPWVFPIIIGIIGILYVIYNIGAAITSIRIQKRGEDRQISYRSGDFERRRIW